MEQIKYIVLNKKKDYATGYLEGIRITDDGIALEEGRESGVYLSRLLDSKTEGNQWQRAVVQSEGYGDDSIKFHFYFSPSNWMI